MGKRALFYRGFKRAYNGAMVIKHLREYGLDPLCWLLDAWNAGIKVSLLK